MKYFYLHPSRPQFFFPKGFIQKKIFLTFYHPYSLRGKISWWFLKNSSIYRFFYSCSDIEPYIPEKFIRRLVGLNAIMAFNTGTKGPEQKITAIGIKQNELFFVKYAQTKVSKKNVENEHNVLNRICFLDFAPKVLAYHDLQDKALLVTDVFMGERHRETVLTLNIISILQQISDVYLDRPFNDNSEIVKSFAHGDFCPWNLILLNNEIKVFDWEMAGIYPLGYDLFTYIFQTSFLLNLNRNASEILSQNIDFIICYFGHFDVEDWIRYLIVFAEMKFEKEKNKNNASLMLHYENLLHYAKKA